MHLYANYSSMAFIKPIESFSNLHVMFMIKKYAMLVAYVCHQRVVSCLMGLLFAFLGLQGEVKTFEPTQLQLGHQGISVVSGPLVFDKDVYTVKMALPKLYSKEYAWFDGIEPVRQRFMHERIATPQPPQTGVKKSQLNQLYGGELVTLYFKDSSRSPLKGRLAEVHELLEQSASSIIIQEGQHIRYVDTDIVSMVQFTTSSRKAPFEYLMPAIEVERSENNLSSKTKHGLSYVVEGLQWQPHYRIGKVDRDRIRLVQYATITNTFRDFENVEIEMVSGVLPGTTIGNDKTQTTSPSLSAADIERARSRGKLPQTHFQWVGTHSLNLGETLRVQLHSTEVNVQPVVFLHCQSPGRSNLSDGFSDKSANNELWDAVRFRNPFDFPLISGKALITESSQFRGRARLSYTAVNSHAIVPISAAEGVETALFDKSLESTKNSASSSPRREGKIRLHNHREQPIEMVIHCDVPGQVLSADGQAHLSGVWHDTNEQESEVQSRITWRFELQPNESRSLRYRYEPPLRKPL